MKLDQLVWICVSFIGHKTCWFICYWMKKHRNVITNSKTKAYWKRKLRKLTVDQISDRAAGIRACSNVQISVRLVWYTCSRACILFLSLCEFCVMEYTFNMNGCVCVHDSRWITSQKKWSEKDREREVPGCCQTQGRDDEVMHCELQKQYGGRSIISGWKKQELADRYKQGNRKMRVNQMNIKNQRYRYNSKTIWKVLYIHWI